MKKIHLVLAAALLSVSAPLHAAPLADPAGDFVPSYTGPQNADLDVLSSELRLEDGVFDFRATLAGAIGTTPGGLYVFGVDRGQGTARFGALATGVLFDAVVVINSSGTGFVRDLLAAVTTNLVATAIDLDGASLSAFVDAALLPSTGFEASDYTYNLWPRSPTPGQSIADFAPDNSNNGVTNVPEPAGWALMIGGLGILGAAARRRRA